MTLEAPEPWPTQLRLTDEGRFEGHGLQLDDDEAPQPEVVEEQVELEVVAANLKVDLTCPPPGSPSRTRRRP